MKRWLDDEAPPGVAELLRDHEVSPSPGSAERVWRRLEAPPPRRGGPAAWGLGLTAAVALLLALPGGEPELLVLTAEAPAWANQAPVEAGQKLARPLVLRTGAEAEVELQTRAKDRVRLSAGGELRTPSAGDWALHAGAVTVWAQPRRPEVPLTVRAGAWTVTVLGTRFRVERLEGDEIRVDVQEGRVMVEGPSESSILGSGESFESSPPPDSTAEARVEPSPHPAPASPPAAPQPRRRQPPATPPSSNKGLETSPARPVPEVLQAETLSRAKSLADVDEAVALFDQAAEMGPPLDEIAAFRAAQRLRDAGRPARAIARLKAHVRRWPNGELTEIAWLDAIRLLLEERSLQDALHALQSYGDLFPASSTQPEVAFLRAEVRRALGENEKAAEAYAISARSPHFAERARFLQGLSLARAGRVGTARKVLQDYLTRHPRGEHADAARRILGAGKKNEAEMGVESFTGTPKEGLQ